MIFILMILLIFLLFFELFIFKNDIMQPPIIVTLMFLLGVGFACYSINLWKTSLSIETVAIIFSGICCFLLVSLFCQQALFVTHKKDNSYKVEKSISIKTWKILFIILINLITILLHYKWLVEIVNIHGGATNYIAMMSLYRSLVTNSIESTSSIPFLLRQLLRVSTAAAYVFLYFFVKNSVFNRKILSKKNIIYLIPVLLYCVDSMLFAARGYILNLVIAGVAFWYIFLSRKKGKFALDFHIIRKGVLIFVVMIVAFISFRGIVGRNMSHKASSDPIYYISVYIGGPIQLLDDFVKNPIQNDDVWGKETFNALYNYMSTKRNSDISTNSGDLEFRYANGYNVGNVYTAFRTYLADFGYGGMLICTAFVSAFYTIFYINIRKRKNTGDFDFKLLVYAYLLNGLFYFSIAERPFSSFFTPGILVTLLIFYIVEKFLVFDKIKFKLHR